MSIIHDQNKVSYQIRSHVVLFQSELTNAMTKNNLKTYCKCGAEKHDELFSCLFSKYSTHTYQLVISRSKAMRQKPRNSEIFLVF